MTGELFSVSGHQKGFRGFQEGSRVGGREKNEGEESTAKIHDG